MLCVRESLCVRVCVCVTYRRARRHQRAAEEAENPEGNVHQQGERNHQRAGAAEKVY